VPVAVPVLLPVVVAVGGLLVPAPPVGEVPGADGVAPPEVGPAEVGPGAAVRQAVELPAFTVNGADCLTSPV